MVGFWIRAGKTIVGTRPGAKFKGQKTPTKGRDREAQKFSSILYHISKLEHSNIV